MFRPFQRTDGLYYVGLVFMVFPLAGTIWFGYPMWTLGPSICFMIAYILIIHIRNQYSKTIACLWFYMLAYIVSMCFLEGSMVWFFFFLSNLLVWRFRDKVRSYRALSYFLALLITVIGGEIRATSFIEHVMVIIVPIFILFMTYSQYNLRVEGEMQDELYQKNETINLLAAENERNRIGRDLHDTLGHTFAMMTLKTELALKQMNKGQYEAVQQQLEELNQISKESMKNVRELINNLKYRTVAEELDNIAEMFAMSEIDLMIDNRLDLAALSPVIQSSLTMILQELTTNIVKHAQANHCQISLTHSEGLKVRVEDDGIGFAKLTGHELHSVRERLHLVKGEVVILSSQHPTVIEVTLEEGGKA